MLKENIIAIEHKDIPDGNIHEPKGITTAVVDTVYVASGSGTGIWKKVPTSALAGTGGAGSVNQVLAVDGLNNQKLVYPVASGASVFANNASPKVVTYPSAYTLFNPVTNTPGSPKEFVGNALGRITYNGVPARKATVTARLSISQAAGADREIELVIYKNGVLVPDSQSFQTYVSAKKQDATLSAFTSLVTGDYFEVYGRNNGASGDVSIFSFVISAIAVLD